MIIALFSLAAVLETIISKQYSLPAHFFDLLHTTRDKFVWSGRDAFAIDFNLLKNKTGPQDDGKISSA